MKLKRFYDNGLKEGLKNFLNVNQQYLSSVFLEHSQNVRFSLEGLGFNKTSSMSIKKTKKKRQTFSRNVKHS